MFSGSCQNPRARYRARAYRVFFPESAVTMKLRYVPFGLRIGLRFLSRSGDEYVEAFRGDQSYRLTQDT